jgi:hypothetical protein
MSAAERGEKDAIDRYCHRELKYEMESYDWTLVKLPNEKTQAIIDSFQIRNGFPKVKWDHGIYTKEEYVKLREKEHKYWKDKSRRGFKDMIPEEVAIIKFQFNSNKGTYY